MLFKKLISTLFLGISLVVFMSGCNLGTEIEQNNAVAIIAAEFTDAETGEPVSETEVMISAAFEGDDEVFEQGIILTDENGAIETPISSLQETEITLLRFSFQHGSEEIMVEEEVNLVLTFEEPYDRVDLNFEIETVEGE